MIDYDAIQKGESYLKFRLMTKQERMSYNYGRFYNWLHCERRGIAKGKAHNGKGNKTFLQIKSVLIKIKSVIIRIKSNII